MEQAGSDIIPCTHCGAKNRIPPDRLGTSARCGKCGHPLSTHGKDAGSSDLFVLRCTACRTKNRVPADKLQSDSKCGKCGVTLNTGVISAPQPFMVTEGNFETEVLKSPLPAVVFAWAPWCPTCRTFIPVVDAYAGDIKGKVRVGKLNVDQNPMLSSRYNILSVPQIFIFDGGQLKESLPGALQKHELAVKMAPYI